MRSREVPRFRDRLRQVFGDRDPRVLLDLVSLAGGQTFSMLIGFLSFAYLARTLNPATYGAVEYSIGLCAFFAILVEGGLGPVAARQVAQDNNRAQELATQIPGARLMLALVAIPALVIVSYLGGGGQQFRALVWLFALSLFAVPWKHDWLLQGLGRMTAAAMAQSIRMATFAVAVLLMVHGPGDVTYVGLAELGAAGVAVAYYLVAQFRFGVPLRFRLAISESWMLIRDGISVSLSGILWAFVWYTPVYLVTYFAGSAETAWYAAPQRIVVSLVNFSFIYFFNFYPVMAARLVHEEEWRGLILSSYRLLAWLGIGLALFLALLSEPISRIAFGSGFGLAAPVFALLIWVLPVRLLSGHARWTLVAGGRQHYLLLSEVIGATVLIVVGVVAIPLAAARGAAIAAVLANLGSWIAADYFTKRHVGRLPPFQRLLAPAAAAVSGAGTAFIANQSPLVAAIIGLSTYAVCAFFFGGDLLADVRKLAYSKAGRDREA